MRIVGLRGAPLPGLGTLRVDYLPVGLVAVLGMNGRARQALHQALAGVSGSEQPVITTPSVPDPLLARLPDGLADRLRTGLGTREAGVEGLLHDGARALAWTVGLDRVEEARERLQRWQARAVSRSSRLSEGHLARIRELESVPDELPSLEAELRRLREEDAEASGDLEAATADWLRERQDAETNLRAYRDRARELRRRLTELQARGAEAQCPTCHRPLSDHAPVVLEVLTDEWDGVVQDGGWWRRRREQLDDKPQHLTELEGRALRLHAAISDATRLVDAARARMAELEQLRARLAETMESTTSGDLPDAPTFEAVGGALMRLGRTLLDEARDRLLDRAAAYLVRLTEGRLLGAVGRSGSRVDLIGPEGPLAAPADEDLAALELAVRLAAVELLWQAVGASDPALIVGHDFDRLDTEARVRAAELLADRVRGGLVQVLVVTRGDVVDLVPEAFDGVLELEVEPDGQPVLRPVPAGMGVVRLSGA